MTRSYTHSRPYPAWNRVQLEAGVASGAALVNCRRTITALLECGDLSPLWPGRQNESGDKSPHSISVLVICPSFAPIPRQKLTATSNYTPLQSSIVNRQYSMAPHAGELYTMTHFARVLSGTARWF